MSDVARAHRAIEVLHSLAYFAPELEEEYVAAGLRPGRMGYFAGRSAPMGAVPAGVTVATFYNFNAELVARSIPRAWTLASPEQVWAARLRGVDRALRRTLGEAVDSPEVAELAGLTREASTALTPEGRPLYAAHAAMPWPDAPHLALWQAITLLREHRGDGHVAVLLSSGLSGGEALVTHTATGRGFTEGMAKRSRGWSDEQWQTIRDGLVSREILDADGLTAEGEALRAHVEDATDRSAAAPYEHLGPDRTARLIELGRGLTRLAVANGAFPDGVFASPR